MSVSTPALPLTSLSYHWVMDCWVHVIAFLRFSNPGFFPTGLTHVFCWRSGKNDLITKNRYLAEWWLLSLYWRRWSCCFSLQPWAFLQSTNTKLFHSTAYSCMQVQNSALIMLSNWLWNQMRKWLVLKSLILEKPPSCFYRTSFSLIFSPQGKTH